VNFLVKNKQRRDQEIVVRKFLGFWINNFLIL
jgi:hypothetical protein